MTTREERDAWDALRETFKMSPGVKDPAIRDAEGAAAFAAHREAAVAAERERVAKMADAEAERHRQNHARLSRVADGAAAETLAIFAAELRSGR